MAPFPPNSNPANANLPALVSAARELWIKKLIDPSRRNTLLFFRDLKVGMLELGVESDAVTQLLRGEEVELETLRTGAVKQTADNMSADATAGGDRESPPRTPAWRSRSTQAPNAVANALEAVKRKALSNKEEKGIDTLQLAYGMASWPVHDGGTPYNAPVLLLPLKIEARGQGGLDARIQLAGEPKLNPVLLHVLAEDYGAQVAAGELLERFVTEEDDGWHLDAAGLVAELQRTVGAGVKDFSITRRALISNFQFARMSMVEDLRKNGGTMEANALIAAVAGHGPTRERLARDGEMGGALGEYSLDGRKAEQEFHVLLSDSSQQAAIEAAERGCNLVVQGPPGTGKSQTIANLIAQCIAQGKKVLFVAEKRAALDAVIKRLSDPRVNLGHLILDLHGADVSRKVVMERLRETLQHIREAQPVLNAMETLEHFEQRRKLLNEHARRVNTPHAPLGHSYIGVLGRLLRLPKEVQTSLRLPDAAFDACTPERLKQLRDWLHELEQEPQLYLGLAGAEGSTPWAHAKLADGTQAQAALALVRQLRDRELPELDSAVQALRQQCAARGPLAWEEIKPACELVRELQAWEQRFDLGVLECELESWIEDLEPASRGFWSRAWAFATKARYRSAVRELGALRRGKAGAAELREEAVELLDLRSRWCESLGAERVVLPECASEFVRAFEAVESSLKALQAFVPQPSPQVGAMASGGITDRWQAWVRALGGDASGAYRIPGVRATQAGLEQAGLGALLSEMRQDPALAARARERFEHMLLFTQLERIYARCGELAQFQGRAHEAVIEEFRKLDAERVRLAAQRVRHAHAQRAIEAMNTYTTEADLVRSEASKRMRHRPLRRLLDEAPHVLTSVAPCWVASPLSVSQLIAARTLFDVVIFDEGSQIPPEDAVAALYRARQVVAAGDQHQLPPTTFFATAVNEEDMEAPVEGSGEAQSQAADATQGYESLLSALESFLPNKMLEWHYRSEDERLITFSNAEVYSGRLVTFPSARADAAIQHVHVPHDPTLAQQDKSASREVERVVQLVLEHARTRPHESLGVIALSITHANRLQAALDRARQAEPDLAGFFNEEREERFFIKNLETVQGDERDAILLSIGHGKNPDGSLPLRFGPVMQAAGYRRLNVAITRAKRRMTVVSSFLAQDIDLSRSDARGVAMLKAYLEYASNGGSRFVGTERAEEVALNAFEADIHGALEARGVMIRGQFGASRFRIDLVAMHPERKGQPILAIECDGASYHSSATARDRDRIRQQQLERLGWTFHRIWSTDWFRNRESELERAMAAYEEAVRRTDRAQDATPATVPSLRAPSAEVVAERPRGVVRAPRPPIPYADSITDYSDEQVLRILDWIASDGLNRTDDELLEEAKEGLGFTRMGSRIRTRLESLIQRWKGRRR